MVILTSYNAAGEILAHMYQETYTSIVMAVLLVIAKKKKEKEKPHKPNAHKIGEWINIQWYIHIMGYYVKINELHISISV